MLIRFTLAINGLEMVGYTPPNVRFETDPVLLSAFLQAVETMGSAIDKMIKEIQFTSWYIYIRIYTDYTIRLIVNREYNLSEIEPIFQQLTEVGAKFYPSLKDGLMMRKTAVEANFVPLLRPLLQADQTPRKKNEDAFKKKIEHIHLSHIGLVGLANAGKTSIKNMFLTYELPHLAGKTLPTFGLEISRKTIDFINEKIAVYDFGGQDKFQKIYFSYDQYWKTMVAIIYVVDLQDAALFEKSRNYLRQIWDIVTKINPNPPQLSILFHKYDPAMRETLKKNLVSCLQVFAEFQGRAVFHLTSILDQTSNVALVKSLYISLPDLMIKRMLAGEFLDAIQLTLLPKKDTQTNSPSKENDEEMKKQIRANAYLFGRVYGFKIQDAWIASLTSESQENGKAIFTESQNIELHKEGNSWLVTVQKQQDKPDLLKWIIDGALEGISKSLNFKPPKIIKEEGTQIVWQLQ